MELKPGIARREAFRLGVRSLRGAGIQSATLDTAVLLGHVTGEPSNAVLLRGDLPLGPDETYRFAVMLTRRCNRETVSRLVGFREFWSLPFSVDPDVLDPRPETELLVEAALAAAAGRPRAVHVLDMGTGSGAVAVALAASNPALRVVAVDKSLRALKLAGRNAAANGVAERVHLVCSDLAEGLAAVGCFDLVVSNPPYVALADYRRLAPEVRCQDPAMALVAGREGTEFYGPVARLAANRLVDGGTLAVEVGKGQDGVVSGIFRDAGFREVKVVADLGGVGRVVTGVKGHA